MSLLLKKLFGNSFSHELWKKSNYYTSPQKNDKHNFENHRPISLLPIFSKVFEKKIYVYVFLKNEQLLNPNLSGFCPSDSL